VRCLVELTDLDHQQLKGTFGLFWPMLELELDAARKLSGT
jgi:hypothetical protein